LSDWHGPIADISGARGDFGPGSAHAGTPEWQTVVKDDGSEDRRVTK
jgi:hypothetical protein